MGPYSIHHFIIQSYARASNLAGFNIVTNVPGCVLVKIRQNFPNKFCFYKECWFNIRGDGKPPVEVLLIESEIAMRCIRKTTIKGQLESYRYYQYHNTCKTVNVNNGRMDRRYGSLFV
jgi:hypothetical protein